MNVFVAMLWKDLVCEWRSRDRVMAMLVFRIFPRTDCLPNI